MRRKKTPNKSQKDKRRSKTKSRVHTPMALTPIQIAQNKMYDNDDFSKWLGIKIVNISKGSCILQMKIKKKMTNGFGIAHGGITYSMADSALAFASNSWGEHAVSIETSISHTKAVHVGEVLLAATTLEHKSRKIATYQVRIMNQREEVVAIFKGTVYHTGKKW